MRKMFLKLLPALFILITSNDIRAQLISNISATSGRSYALGKLIKSTAFYTDRTYQTTSVPTILNNAPFIKTANDDKADKSTSLLSFTLSEKATVYVAYDPRETKLPSWLSSWQKSSSQIGINDPKISNMILFSKSFAAGKVTLGGNLASPAAGALNMYFVIAVASSTTPPPPGTHSLTIDINGNGSVTKSPDQASYNDGTNVTLTAKPASGQQFSGWGGDATGSSATFVIKMDDDKSVTANFTATSTGGGGTGGGVNQPASNAIFVENVDKFPANDRFTFSHIQIPWSRDKQTYNANHDSSRVRIHNNGINSLVISKLTISNPSYWKIDKLNGVTFSSSQLPITIASGKFLDLMVKFIAKNLGNSDTRVKVLHETLTITSNDDIIPEKKVFLDGIWQYSGEGKHEPYAHEIFNAFNYTSNSGYNATDPDKGDSTKLKGDEIKPDYFIKADASIPVTIVQLASYRGCCYSTESIKWFPIGSSSTTTLFSSALKDGQTLLPHKTSDGSAAITTFSPSGPFGIMMGYGNTTAPAKNPLKKLGVRVYKAFDASGNIQPNAYLLTSDYIGTDVTNYDYQDNVYFITNVRPSVGTAFYSPLNASPSDIDFGEKVLQTSNSFQLNISNGGKSYSNGSKDPSLAISSIMITGENKSEFSASMPSKTTLNAGEGTTINVSFKPASQGLKIADLLIFYKNSPAPKRVPLYGIAKKSGVTVTANYRVNSGGSAVTINGKSWAADNKYAHDNLEPYKNSGLKEIAGTDEDVLYLDEQSSNGDKKPFRYEFPVSNGTYYVRLHFAELFWGAPGSGFLSGAGSRVFSVKLENQYKLVNFDPTAEVGGATAVVKNIPVTVSDGKLNIDFSAVANRPMVCAVEVYSFSGGARALTDTIVTTAEVVHPVLPQPEQVIETPQLYPNPLHDNFTLKFPKRYQGIYHLQLTDLLGRKYDLGKARLNGATSLNINISKYSLKPGIYLLRINSNNKEDVLKVMIQ